MNFLVDQIREQKLLEMEVEFDSFIKEKEISDKAVIYSMTFDKEVFEKEEEIREYIASKYIYNYNITESDTAFDCAIVFEGQVDGENTIEIELRRGVTAMAADLVLTPSFSEIQFNEKGEVNLSSKFGTINLTEGIAHIIEVARVAEGEHPAYGKLKITQEHLEQMELNFKSNVTGVDLAINEDHQKNEAFGWFKDVFLSYDKQVLYAQVQWNTKGTQALSEKEYRYFSPEFRFNYTHPHTGTEHGSTLLGGALTNYPFLKMDAITELSNKQTKGDTMSTIELSVHNEKVVELSSKIDNVTIQLQEKTDAVKNLSDKVSSLEEEIAKGKKEIAHKKLFDTGKINAAQLVALNEGKSTFEVLSLNEKMNTEEAGSAKKEDKEEIKLSEKEQAIADSLGLSPEEFKAGE